MIPWLEAIALWLADFYLAATVLLVIACAACGFLKQPAQRMAVSWGTLVALLVAAFLCLSASRPRVDLRSLFARSDQAVMEVETTPSEIAFEPSFAAPLPQKIAERPADVAAETEISAEPPARPTFDAQLIIRSALFLFLMGTVLMAVRLAVGVWQASQLVRQSGQASPRLVDELRAIVGPLARLPRLRSNSHLATPVATGARRPTIVLPERFCRSSPRGELQAVLAHEWAHIRNGDLSLLALDRCLLPLMWAHPMYWWLRRRMRQDQEFLADAAAASLAGPADYAAQLVGWARELAGVQRVAISNAVGIWERPSEFALRISAILHQSDQMTLRCTGRTRTAVIVCLTAASLLAASLSVRPPNAESAPLETTLAQVDPPPADAKTERPTLHAFQVAADEVGGTCNDKEQNPLSGVRVSLYHLNYDNRTQRLVQQTSTNDAGQFIFRKPPTMRQPPEESYCIVAQLQGRATAAKYAGHRGEWVDLTLPNAEPFQGTVKDRQGKPIADAVVSFGPTLEIHPLIHPIDGIRSARTNAKGEFLIGDLPQFQYDNRLIPSEDGMEATLIGPPWLTIAHRDYAQTLFSYYKIPGQLDAVLGKGGVIEGRVIWGQTGMPATGERVEVHGLSNQGTISDAKPFLLATDKWNNSASMFSALAKTDEHGRFQIGSVPAGKFEIVLHAENSRHTAVAIAPLAVKEGQFVQAPPLRLIKGGIIKGRLIDNQPGKPVHLEADEYVRMAAWGPSTPDAAGPNENARVGIDGTFEFRLAPGTNFLVLQVAGPLGQMEDPQPRAVTVIEGGEKTIEFRVIRIKPGKKASGNSTQVEKPHSVAVASAQPPRRPAASNVNSTASTANRQWNKSASTSADGGINQSAPTGQKTGEVQIIPDHEVVATVNGRPIFALDIFERAFAEPMTPDGVTLLYANAHIAKGDNPQPGEVTAAEYRQLQERAIRKYLKDFIRTRVLVQTLESTLQKEQKEKMEEAIKRMYEEYVGKLQKELKVNSHQEVDAKLRLQGTTLESLKTEFRNRLLADEYLRASLKKRPDVGRQNGPDRREEKIKAVLVDAYRHARIESKYLAAKDLDPAADFADPSLKKSKLAAKKVQGRP